ncbi:sigma factor [Odoribacter laneus]|uniref:sigma factor n=1 Tax=Odoribacter laneus TaxID=626933 RepID=UPI000906E150|nr:sigma factor [Odoribacter laneus]
MRITEFKNQILPLRDKLFRLALRITQNPAEAEDIVQEVMLRRWNCREEWTKIESKEAYCCTMNRKIVLFKILSDKVPHSSS